MRWLYVLVCTLVVCAGCAGDGEKSPWDDALKDLRGDNMRMHTDSFRSLENPNGSR